jgi:6-phosphogluconate dehydrogenase
METTAPLEMGVIGLGRMGGNLALQALDKGVRVVGYERAGGRQELLRAGLVEIKEPAGFREHLAQTRAIFLYVPAGPAVDEALDALAARLEPGDIVVDGGNSYWGDSIRRHARARELGLQFVDLGTSGGVDGARHGACFMAGGDPEPVARIEPLLRRLAVEGGYVHTGPAGTGHYAKLVHNGIEFGMLQAIAEGIDLLEHHHEKLDIAAILRCWRHGSVIRSWLVQLMEEAYRLENGTAAVPPCVEDTGEVNWLITDAMRMEVPVPVMAQAVMQLLGSRDRDRIWARAVAMMRHGFGGHPYGRDDAIARERRTARVGDYFRYPEC